ncbi:hypothetical protein [Nostoc sp. UHCC 0302]|uniref:hypothetical protein n=1 Tax=Nostoc sp. UHCC 0302 TaxID=3134896 RepID=UPI00311CBFED
MSSPQIPALDICGSGSSPKTSGCWLPNRDVVIAPLPDNKRGDRSIGWQVTSSFRV